MRLIITLTLLALLSCHPTELIDTNYDRLLVEKMIIEPEVKAATKMHGKLYVLEADYCASHDCERLLADLGLSVLVMSMEELFMRNIKDFVRIKSIDKEDGRPTIKYRVVRKNQRTSHQEFVLQL